MGALGVWEVWISLPIGCRRERQSVIGSISAILLCDSPKDEVAVCMELLDSIFNINLRTGRIVVLFYPAGVRRAVDKDHYVFYARGGFRLFVTPAGSGLQ
jgi:hypothetical protein